MKIRKLPYDLTVCKVMSTESIDLSADFCFIARTDEEISLVCETDRVPVKTVAREDGWRAMRVEGILDFSLTGVLSGIADVLAENGISIFAVSTYSTDYILVKQSSLDDAAEALCAAGYEITE